MSDIRKDHSKAKDITTEDSKFEHDFQMLQYFQEEFVYRHKHFWSLAIKCFLLTVIITIVPIVSEISGIVFAELIDRFLIVFPAIGFILACGSHYLLLDEAKKMSNVNKAKYRINKLMDERYHYNFYHHLQNNEFHDKKGKIKPSLANIIAAMLLLIELLIILFVVIAIMTGTTAPVSQ